MADPDQTANARLAYQEVCKSYQAIVDFRVKLLGFLPLATGLGAYGVLGKDEIPAWSWVAGIFGFLITLGLFLYELRGLPMARTRARRMSTSRSAWMVRPTIFALSTSKSCGGGSIPFTIGTLAAL